MHEHTNEQTEQEAWAEEVTADDAPITEHPEDDTDDAEAHDEAAESDDPEPDDGDARLRREAKRHRLRLREVEAERDELAAKLQATVTSVIDEKLQHIGMTSKILRMSGANLDTLIDSEGGFDDAGLLHLVNSTREDLGLPEDPTAKILTRTHERIGRIDWSRHHLQGHIPLAGTGPEKPYTGGDWGSVIRDR
ncbi:hypothetical protein [Nesterenkonia marinintestina]|uniref:hypothetical protein n=1 Tax=Nesterenkonia marinintestina TaxID=2979865 RepID=UPI0021C03AEA|nr:hypothetical protein [Nesterenkonia sp. GX14115]